MSNADFKEPEPETLSFYEFFQRFPDEAAATRFFEDRRWRGIVTCPHCESGSVSKVVSGKPMPYRCRDCREYFSVRIGTVLNESKLPLHKWLMAIYMLHSARKGVSSVQMAKQLGVTQKTAWFLNHRIREAMKHRDGFFRGEVEVDETYFGGKEKNKHNSKRLRSGRGTVGKVAVVGARQRKGKVRAAKIGSTGKEDLQGFIQRNVALGSTVYTDDHKSYGGMKGFKHSSVNHSAGEYVNGDAHTNGIESFWALLKRGYYGIYHYMSEQHLHRYIEEFSRRSNTVGKDMLDCIAATLDGMMGRRLTYEKLIAA